MYVLTILSLNWDIDAVVCIHEVYKVCNAMVMDASCPDPSTTTYGHKRLILDAS